MRRTVEYTAQRPLTMSEITQIEVMLDNDLAFDGLLGIGAVEIVRLCRITAEVPEGTTPTAAASKFVDGDWTITDARFVEIEGQGLLLEDNR